MRYPLEHRVIRPQPYTRSEATDIRKTFAKARKAAKAAPAPAPQPEPAPVIAANVQPLRKARP